jgi:hypothetical protein
MAKTKKVNKAIEDGWGLLSLQLSQINFELANLERRKAGILAGLRGILASLDNIPENWLIPPELRLAENATLGDALESILKERGALSQREIIDALNGMRFPLNPKHPHVTIANAVSRDTRKRFKRLKDGRVALTEEKQ